MKQIAIYILGGIMLASCKQPDKSAEKKDTLNNAVKNKTTVTVRPNDTISILTDTISKVTIPDSAIQVSFNLNSTKNSKVSIIAGEHCNAQDLNQKVAAKKNWIGLFYRKNDYYLSEAKIRFIREQSNLDNEGEMTGSHLISNVKDHSLLFISGTDSLINGPIKALSNSIDPPLPNKKVAFKYNEVIYTLYATGNYKHTDSSDFIYDYKLYLTANIKGHFFNQIIWALEKSVPYGDVSDGSQSINLEFIGDLDGDNIPDIILSASGFSYAITNLYLSKPAGNKAILKLVSDFWFSD